MEENGGSVESRMKVEGRRGSKVQVSVHQQHSSHNATTILLMLLALHWSKLTSQSPVSITHSY